jgi:Secretion system C-terminal sorting domain/PA domain
METATQRDSTGRYPKRMVTQRQCGKLPKDSLTGKVALLYMNSGCDVSTQVYNAQKSGAIVVIVIHTTNNRDSVALPKQGQNQVRYDDGSKVRIPCFTVRKGIGDKLTTMLPSLVGIQRPRTTVDPQSSVVANNPPVTTTEQIKDKITDADAILNAELSNTTGFGKLGFSVSPNPTRNQANVTYQFLKPTDVTIEAKTASGQVIFSKILRGATVGNVEIPTVDYPNGTYFVTLQYGKEVKTKKLVVRH